MKTNFKNDKKWHTVEIMNMNILEQKKTILMWMGTVASKKISNNSIKY